VNYVGDPLGLNDSTTPLQIEVACYGIEGKESEETRITRLKWTFPVLLLCAAAPPLHGP